MNRLTLIIFLIIPILNFSQELDSVNDLSILNWLAGTWEQKGDKTITTEKWEMVSSHTFEGINYVRKIGEPEPNFSESLRLLNLNGEIFYLAKVAHNEMPIPFRLISINEDKFIFENMNHDFPQRITYYKKGNNSLTVIVESVSKENNRFFELQLRRVN